MLSLPVTPGRATELLDTGSQTNTNHERFKHIEIEINTACCCTCFGCDRFSDVTNAPNMTVEQVNLFVQESLDLKWQWERIRLLGGEPTIHPRFKEMCEAIMVYRRFYPKCFIQVLSNGLGKLSQYRDWLIDHGIDPHTETKVKGVTPSWFGNTRITPLDRDANVGILSPCGIFGIRGCGLALTNHGFFMDGAGASIARVAGYDIGAMRLRDVTWEAMMEQSKVLCRVCGHWNPEHTVVTKKVSETGEITGPFWTQKLREFKENRPILKVYGAK